MDKWIVILIIMVILWTIQLFIIFNKNKYIEELEEIITKQIKLESKRLDDLKQKIDKDWTKVDIKKKELVAVKRKLNKDKPKIKIIKTNFTKAEKSNTIISDFTNLDNKISLFEKELKKLKEGTKENE